MSRNFRIRAAVGAFLLVGWLGMWTATAQARELKLEGRTVKWERSFTDESSVCATIKHGPKVQYKHLLGEDLTFTATARIDGEASLRLDYHALYADASEDGVELGFKLKF